MKGKALFLGSGTSQGVPVIACDCPVCISSDTRDKRLRSSIWIQYNDKNYVIDAGPDFRQQLLRENFTSLEGVLFTHEHKDHIAGLDDVRAFNYKQNRPMDVYCTAAVEEALRREYQYVFSENRYPGIPQLQLNRINANTEFWLGDLKVIPIEVMHYKMPVLGFRFGDFAYITDAKTVAQDQKQKLIGLEILVVNSLHKSPHISHFNLEEALAFIAEVKPKKAYLTHISHLFGKHVDIEKELPENVYLSFDGLTLEFQP